MPIYEYQCESCDRVNEVIQKVSDPAPSECSYCGSDRLSKKMSLSAFHLKGSGWYTTDYKKSPAKAVEEKGAEKTDVSAKTENNGKAETAAKNDVSIATSGSDSASSGTKAKDAGVDKKAAKKTETKSSSASVD